MFIIESCAHCTQPIPSLYSIIFLLYRKRTWAFCSPAPAAPAAAAAAPLPRGRTDTRSGRWHATGCQSSPASPPPGGRREHKKKQAHAHRRQRGTDRHTSFVFACSFFMGTQTNKHTHTKGRGGQTDTHTHRLFLLAIFHGNTDRTPDTRSAHPSPRQTQCRQPVATPLHIYLPPRGRRQAVIPGRAAGRGVVIGGKQWVSMSPRQRHPYPLRRRPARVVSCFVLRKNKSILLYMLLLVRRTGACLRSQTYAD